MENRDKKASSIDTGKQGENALPYVIDLPANLRTLAELPIERLRRAYRASKILIVLSVILIIDIIVRISRLYNTLIIFKKQDWPIHRLISISMPGILAIVSCALIAYCISNDLRSKIGNKVFDISVMNIVLEICSYVLCVIAFGKKGESFMPRISLITIGRIIVWGCICYWTHCYDIFMNNPLSHKQIRFVYHMRNNKGYIMGKSIPYSPRKACIDGFVYIFAIIFRLIYIIYTIMGISSCFMLYYKS